MSWRKIKQRNNFRTVSKAPEVSPLKKLRIKKVAAPREAESAKKDETCSKTNTGRRSCYATNKVLVCL